MTAMPWKRNLLLAAALGALAPAASAHQGPPFPILVDRPVGPYLASVWTDPDIGIGTFFVVLEPPKDGGALPVGTTVRIGVRPVSGRLPEAIYAAEPQKVSYGERYFAQVPFDRGEMWKVHVTIAGPRGGGELAAEVEATPDGTIGPISLVVYSFPFLAVGFLWWKATVRRRRPPAAPASGVPGSGLPG
jgi:hypothetical protein